MRKGKVSLPSTSLAPSKTGKGVGEETLLGGDGGDALVVQVVGPGDADAVGAIDVHTVAVNVDQFAGDAQVLELEVGGDGGEGRGIFLGGSEVVEMGQLHHHARIGFDQHDPHKTSA
jgi:hypothetical protein